VVYIGKIEKKLIKNKIEVFIILLSLFIFSVNILDFPIHVEFGIQGYIAQELLRGSPIYSTSVFCYPPIVYLLNALWMKLFFFLPNYLAIRIGGAILGSITVLLAYKVFDKITKNKLISFFSVIIILSFTILIEFFLNTSVKTALVFFMLLMYLVLFKGHYLISGVLTSLCFLSWQIGGVFFLGPISYYILNKEKKKNYIKFFVGLAIPLIFVGLYFLFNKLLDTFIIYTFSYAMLFKKEIDWMSNAAFMYIRAWTAFNTTEVFFLLLGLIGSLFILFRLIRDNDKKEILSKNKELFSFVFPCLLLFLYLFIDFQAGEDMIPLIPAISLSGAFVLSKISKKIPAAIVLFLIMIYGFGPMFQPIFPPNPLLIEAKSANNINDLLDIMSNYTFPEIVYYSLFRRLGHERTLDDQLKIAEYIKNNTNENDPIFSLDAAELLFLTGRRNIVKHPQLSSGVYRIYAREEGIVEEMKNKITEGFPKFIVSWNVNTVERGIKFLNIEEFISNKYEKVDLHPKYIIWKRLER